MKTPKFTPENLNLWIRPSHYMGAEWPEHYVFLSHHRDSDCLAESNFAKGLEALGGASETVLVIRESHWAVGWVEWIGIHQSDTEALKKADKMEEALQDYCVLDEDDFSNRECEEANRVWKNCYTPKERSAYIRKFRSQFDFSDFSDLLSVVRGEYFNGYASELIY